MKLKNVLFSNLNHDIDSLLHQLYLTFVEKHDELWLVGGTIRDMLDREPPKDFDIAFAGDLTPQIKRWANQQGGHWFWLDKIRNQSRILFANNCCQFDFAPLRAGNIYADLRLRDFTLNAMALSFNDFSEENGSLIDPLNGLHDLEAGILRCCGPNVLTEDPLRVVKGVRHHALRGWHFDEQSAVMMTGAASFLHSVAGERIRNELGQILNSGRLISSVDMLEKYFIFDNLFPGITTAGLKQDLALLSSRIKQLEQIPFCVHLLDQSIEEGLSRRTLFFLACLFQRVHSLNDVSTISQRLRLSTNSRSIIQTLYGVPISLERFKETDNPRIAALKVEEFGKNCLELILFTLACLDHNRLDLSLTNKLHAYQQQLERGRISDLLDGKEICTLTSLSQGQIIGEYQRRLKTAEIAGEISNKATAERWIKGQLSD